MKIFVVLSIAAFSHLLVSAIILDFTAILFSKPNMGVSFGISSIYIWYSISMIGLISIVASKFFKGLVVKIIASISIIYVMASLNPYNGVSEEIIISLLLISSLALIIRLSSTLIHTSEK